MNLPAIPPGPKNFVVGAAEYADKAIDKAIPVAFEKPTNPSIGERITHGGMAIAYAFGAIGSFAPFGLSIVGDALVGGAGAAAAAYGNSSGKEEIANQGRLAMQTGIVASGASAAGFVIPIPFVAGVANSAAYARAAIKSVKAAFTGGATPPQAPSTKSPW